ncbi:MAG TPA: hypothetical protein VHJ78_01475, partial [Actinomycetota bacterium]|nr:hypothetical protein [Actinomycetota bacterium]
VCSVNVHEKGWVDVCSAARSVGIGVELGVWTSGDAVTLRANGVPPGTTRVLAESTVTDPETAVAEAVRILRALGSLPVPVLVHGEETGAWPVLEYAMRMRIDTRIGFEDVLVTPRGWLATGNDHLVAERLAVPVPLLVHLEIFYGHQTSYPQAGGVPAASLPIGRNGGSLTHNPASRRPRSSGSDVVG